MNTDTTCNAYLLVLEQDQRTVNMAMAGLNAHQVDWYYKNASKDFPGVCALPTGAGVAQVSLDTLPEPKPWPSIPIYTLAMTEYQGADKGGNPRWVSDERLNH